MVHSGVHHGGSDGLVQSCFDGINFNIPHVSSTVLPVCAVNNTFITPTARLPTLVPFSFCSSTRGQSPVHMYTIVPEAEVNTGEYSLVYKPRRSRGLYTSENSPVFTEAEGTIVLMRLHIHRYHS